MFEKVLKYIYSGSVEISEETVKDVLHLADYLQINSLKTECENFFLEVGTNRLNVKNCLSLCVLAGTYDLERLSERSNNMLRGHLLEILKSEDIVDIAFDGWMDVLTDAELSYVPAVLYYEALQTWLKHDPEKRKAAFEKLFCTLDLSSMTSNDMEEKVKKDKNVTSSVMCMNHIKDYDQKLSKGNINPNLVEKEVLIVSGGGGENRSDMVSDATYAYIINDDKWVQLPPMPLRSNNHAIHSYGKQLYIHVARKFNSQVSRFEVENKKWSVMRSFYEPRTNDLLRVVHGSVSLGWEIYVLKSTGLAAMDKEFYLSCHKPTSDSFDRIELLKGIRVSTILEAQICTALNKYVCVLVKQPGRVQFLVTEPAKLNAPVNVYNKGVQYHSILYSDESKVYAMSVGKRCSLIFDLKSRSKQWKRCRQGLPPIPEQADRQNFKTCVHNGTIFVFGGKSKKTKASCKTVYKLTVGKDLNWVKLSDAPGDFTMSKACIATLPSSVLTCPPNCAHCKDLYFYRTMEDNTKRAADNDFYYEDEEDDYEDDYSSDEDSFYQPYYGPPDWYVYL